MRDETVTADDGLDVAAPLASPRPDVLAARVALDRSLPRHVRDALRRGDPTCVVVSVPSAPWCRPVLRALVHLLDDARIDSRIIEADTTRPAAFHAASALFMRDGTERSQGRPDLSARNLPALLGRGGTAIGIAADRALLPAEVRAAADVVVEVAPLTARELRRVIRTVARGRLRGPVDDRLAAAAHPDDLGMAVRPRASADVALARLRRIVEARNVAKGGEDVPRLEDLAGYGAARDWGLSLVRDVHAHRDDPSSVTVATLTRSLLLDGPPGVGKTMFAKSLARSADLPLVETSYAQWQTTGGGYLNDVMSAMSAAFAAARAAAKIGGGLAILFVDELDSVPDRRRLTGGRNDDWWCAIVNALLTLCEQSSPTRHGLVLIGATNHAARIDPALRRSGRFDTLIRLDLPDATDLAVILRTHLGDDLPDADLAAVAAVAPPSSGADAARWVREARRAARDRGAPMTFDDVLAQVAPPDRRDVAMLRQVALHEAAHAVVGLRTGYAPIRSVSLVGGARSAGATLFDRDPDAIPTRRRFEQNVVTILAGRAADQRYEVPDAGSGGSRASDLGRATAIVAAVHAAYGLGDTLATLADADGAHDLVGRDPRLRDLVEADLQRLYAEAVRAVDRHAPAIEAVAEALLRARVLSGSEVERIADAVERRPVSDVPRRPI